jgi:hypothetical protein
VSPLAFFGGLTVLAVLGALCAERPRLGGALTVTLFGSLAVWMACEGAVAATIYCVVYGCLFGFLARMSFTMSQPSTPNATKE